MLVYFFKHNAVGQCNTRKSYRTLQILKCNMRVLIDAEFHTASSCPVVMSFSIPCIHSDNTAGVVTLRGGFRRRAQEIYHLPVIIEDSGYPAQSSTGTLTIRVCGCDSNGFLLTCSAEAIFLPVGLSTGALIAILLCIIILLGEYTARHLERKTKTSP